MEEESLLSDESNVTTLAAVVRAAVRRYFPVVIVCALLGGFAGFGFSKLSPKSFTATASVLLRPSPGNSLSPQIGLSNANQLTIAMTTEVSLVTTPVVAAKASSVTGGSLPATDDTVSATVPPSTQIVVVSYTAPTATRAEAGANAYAKAFLSFRASNAKAATEAQTKSLQSQLKAADAALKTAAAQAASNTDPRSYAAQELQLYAERVAALNNSISTASTVSLDPGTVIRTGVLPTTENGVPGWVLVVAGAILGMVLGLLAAVARQLGDKRIRNADTTAVEGLPILAAAAVPMQVLDPSDAASDDMQSLLETFRQLRTAVTTSAGRGTVVAFTSLRPAKPTAVLAYNLTTTLTLAGYSACVVDLDSSAPGLLEQLGSAAESTADSVGFSGVEVIRADQQPHDFYNPELRTRLEKLRATNDFTILAAAPCGTADGDVGASLADATVLVASENRSTVPGVRLARERMLRLGAPSLGLFLVGRVVATGHRKAASARVGAPAVPDSHALRD